MAKSVQLRWAIWLYLVLTWSAVCYAAEARTLSEGLGAIPLRDVGTALILAIVGGVAGTLVKLTKPGIVVLNLPLEIAKDSMASLVVGLLTFFFSSWWEGVSFYLQAALILLAGYGGSRVLDVALDEGFIPWGRALLGRLIGRPLEKPIPTPREDSPP